MSLNLAAPFLLIISPEFRQCLIYDSNALHARLIGIEYMVPKHVYLTLDAEEQKLWHSHEFEVTSGMLVMPRPSSEPDEDKWTAFETEAVRQVVGWYGKTWHLWQVDREDKLPVGLPRLMGSLSGEGQVELAEVLRERDQRVGVDFREKARVRKEAGIEGPGSEGGADSWWREAKGEE